MKSDYNYLSPYIRIAMDDIVPSPWELAERVLFDYEIQYIKKGSVLITIEDQTYTGTAGDIFLYKPRQRHSMKIIGDAPLQQPHIHFDLFYQPDSPDVEVSFEPLVDISDCKKKLFREDSTSLSAMHLPNYIRLKNPDIFEKMLFDIINEYQMKLPFYEITIKGLFVQLWAYLLRENFCNEYPDSYSNMKMLSKIKNHLELHIRRNITLDELAQSFSLNKYYLVRIFKKAYGIPPITYHNQLRIKKTIDLIKFTNLSLTEISSWFGFGSLHAYSRAFKNVEGISPSTYRKQNV